MKIALLSRWYWEENRRSGGDGGPTRQLAEALAARGHEVVVLTQSASPRLRQEKIGTLEVWVSSRKRRRGLLTGLRDKLAKGAYGHRKIHSDAQTLRDFITRRGPFDVIWAQTESPDGVVAAFAAKLGFQLPPVLVQIQALRYRFERGTPVFTEKMPLTLAFRHATTVIANSEMIAEQLAVYTSPDFTPAQLAAKVKIVYPNVHRTFLLAAHEDSLHTPPKKDRILFLGALNPGKGALVFLRSLPLTEMSKRSSVFTIIGDFTEDNPRFVKRWEEVKEAVRVRTLGARIEYLGKVTPFEVIRQIKLAQAVVIPSLFDAFGRALVEALMLGRPVITTNRVGAAALVHAHQCGIVVPPNDSEALAHAIDAVGSPIVPFAANAAHLGPRLQHEFTPEAIAIQLEQHLARTAGMA